MNIIIEALENIELQTDLLQCSHPLNDLPSWKSRSCDNYRLDIEEFLFAGYTSPTAVTLLLLSENQCPVMWRSFFFLPLFFFLFPIVRARPAFPRMVGMSLSCLHSSFSAHVCVAPWLDCNRLRCLLFFFF